LSHDLNDLGWSGFFLAQLDLAELELARLRIAEVHRTRLVALGATGRVDLTSPHISSGDIAVGDWVLANDGAITRVLEAKTLIQRRAAGEESISQVIAANVDTLFIVTSCNADFNAKRLERYLAVAMEAGVEPVIILTKADISGETDSFVDQAKAIDRRVEVVALNAKGDDIAERLAMWCHKGATVALVGSSGVGKTTLTNALTGSDDATAGIRDDSRGRHTTTHRALHELRTGGWIIDTPGMRELRMSDAAEGIAELFDDISALEGTCKFRDCEHEGEPGCAIRAALASGAIEQARFERWDKLRREDQVHTEAARARAAKDRKLSQTIKQMKKERKRFTTKD